MNQKKRILIGLVLMVFVIVGIYLYSHFNPEEYAFFPKCPVYLLTGYKCPGCGSQRAFFHLFHGHFSIAFKQNPLMILLAPYLLSGIYFEYVANKTNQRIVRLHHLLFGKWAVLVIAIIFVLYTILRNI